MITGWSLARQFTRKNSRSHPSGQETQHKDMKIYTMMKKPNDGLALLTKFSTIQQWAKNIEGMSGMMKIPLRAYHPASYLNGLHHHATRMGMYNDSRLFEERQFDIGCISEDEEEPFVF